MTTILTKLEAKSEITNERFGELAGVVGAVHCEVAPGVFVHLTLSQDGLVIKQGEIKVGFPLNELISVAAFHELRLAQMPPELKAPMPLHAGAHDDHFANK